MKLLVLVGVAIVALIAAGLGWLRLQRLEAANESARAWAELEQPTNPRGQPTFEAEMVVDLPDPARRYFLHALAPGTPLASTVRLSMRGAIRLSPEADWMPLSAEQILSPPRGFVWKASAGSGATSFTGADVYLRGQGSMRFWLLGLFPVAQAAGPDVSRSAAGRLAAESIWLPSSLLPQHGVSWQAERADTARATLMIDGEPVSLSLVVEQSGALRSVSLERWGDQNPGGRFDWIPFGGLVEAEGRFSGRTIPTRLGVGWWHGTDQYFEFFRVETLEAEFH